MTLVDVAIALLASSLKAGTPLLLATLGEIYAERSGVLNLGVEGMMAGGALAAFATSYLTGNPWIGVGVAAIVGGALASIHAVVSITMKADQIVSGLALTIFGLGITGLLGKSFVGLRAPTIKASAIPVLSDLPILGRVLFRQDLFFYIAVALAVALWFVLFRSSLGLEVRTVGENPQMADTLGISVAKRRYFAVVLGGVLAGLGGAYLSLAYTPLWVEGMTLGRGWIAVGLTIVASWNPLHAIWGAYLFGGTEALRPRLQTLGVSVAPEFLQMVPYILTIVALTAVATGVLRGRTKAPESLTVPYEREQG